MIEQFDNVDARRVVEDDVRSFMENVLLDPSDGEVSQFEVGAPFTEGEMPLLNDREDTIPYRPLNSEDGQIHVVPWVWKGIDAGRGLAQLGATYKPVKLRGVTVVTRLDDVDGDDAFRLYRFIDWMDAFAQAGVSVMTRPIVDQGVWWDGQADDLERRANMARNEGDDTVADELEAAAERRRKRAEDFRNMMEA